MGGMGEGGVKSARDTAPLMFPAMLRLPQRTDTTLFPHGFVGAITVAARIQNLQW